MQLQVPVSLAVLLLTAVLSTASIARGQQVCQTLYIENTKEWLSRDAGSIPYQIGYTERVWDGRCDIGVFLDAKYYTAENLKQIGRRFADQYHGGCCFIIDIRTSRHDLLADIYMRKRSIWDLTPQAQKEIDELPYDDPPVGRHLNASYFHGQKNERLRYDMIDCKASPCTKTIKYKENGVVLIKD